MNNEPRYSKRSSRRSSKKVDRKKAWILFIAIAIVVVGVSGVIKLKFYNTSSKVEAAQVEEQNESQSEVEVQENVAVNNKDLIDESKTEDGKFIETYIKQQSKGQMPDGADGKKVVYLTFDDGPSENITPQILDILKEENVQATFFVLGKSVDSSDKTKEILKRQVEEGNSIGIHTYSHNYHNLYPNRVVNVDNFMAEVEKTKKSLKDVLGEEFDTKIIRLPGGHMSWKGTDALDARFEQDGYSYIDWNALSKDAEGPKKNAEQLTQEAITSCGTKEKVVMLMHDIRDKEETAKSLPAVIHHFKENGYEFKVIK